MANQSFSASVGAWCEKIPEAAEAIFKRSAQTLVHELDDLISQMVYSDAKTDYQRTGFLRASLVASNTAMPTLSRKNPGVPVVPDYGEVLMIINNTDLGMPLFLGYTAEYGAYVHYGANGRAPRPWVTLIAQRWQAIVERESAEVMREFGL